MHHITFRSFMVCLGVFGFLLLGDNSSSAAEKRDLIGSFKDWDALQITKDSGEKTCYIISVPKETTPKNVRRGKIYITITHRPNVRVFNEVNIVVGYPFQAGSEAIATIGGKRYTMFTEGDGAWRFTTREDTKMVEAMRAGNALQMRGTSGRGTNTSDRYSLLGFTAAHNAITEACQ